jgi:hypothetical protein
MMASDKNSNSTLEQLMLVNIILFCWTHKRYVQFKIDYNVC